MGETWQIEGSDRPVGFKLYLYGCGAAAAVAAGVATAAATPASVGSGAAAPGSVTAAGLDGGGIVDAAAAAASVGEEAIFLRAACSSVSRCLMSAAFGLVGVGQGLASFGYGGPSGPLGVGGGICGRGDGGGGRGGCGGSSQLGMRLLALCVPPDGAVVGPSWDVLPLRGLPGGAA